MGACRSCAATNYTITNLTCSIWESKRDKFILSHHVYGRIHSVEVEQNYHTLLRASYLNGTGLAFKFCEVVRENA